METKFVKDLKVKGKDGYVNVSSIQKHKPEVPMCFIVTEQFPGFLFCQENHPVIVNIDNTEMVVNAKFLKKTDKIWIDFSNTQRLCNTRNINDENKIPSYKWAEYYPLDGFFNRYENCLNGEISEQEYDWLSGSNKYNVQIRKFLFDEFPDDRFLSLLEIMAINKTEIYSPSLLFQLALIAYNMKKKFDFIIYEDENDVHWIIDNIQDLEYKTSIGYTNIKYVINDIKNFNGYVYDLKTDSNEFMNNCVQTHNSFHCFEKTTKVYLKNGGDNFSEISFEDLWNKYNDIPVKECLYSNNLIQYEKDVSHLDLYTCTKKVDYCEEPFNIKSKTTKIKKIIRHIQDPSTKMVNMTFDNGKELKCQDNHPLYMFTKQDLLILIYPRVLFSGDAVGVGSYIVSVNDNKSKRFVTLKSISYINNIPEDDFVYDLTTESGDYIANDIYVHNTGGAVEFKKIDILKELSINITDSDESHLRRLFTQKENDLYCNNDLTKITINKKIFKDEFALKKEDKKVKLPLGYFYLHTGNLRVDATIEQEIEIEITEDYSETNDEIEIVYGKDDKILTAKIYSISPEKIAQHIDILVGGKSPYTTPESLLLKFHNDLSQFNNYDMVHLEVIISAILRNRLDPMIPARLKEPYDPITFSIKTLPSTISWSLGIAYENISKSISTGMISDDTKNLSQIEKVLFGEPLSELSIQKLKEKRKK